MNKITPIDEKNINDKIFNIRSNLVILDQDLAELYGVETKRINEAVKNNPNKFPSDFYFELDVKETNDLKSKLSTSSWGGRRKPPKVFTEQGIYMLATILKSKTATDVTVAIMRTFVNMRKFLQMNAEIFRRIDIVEKKQFKFQLNTDEKFNKIFRALEDKTITPDQGIFYDGQIFDAYQFVSNIIKSAKKSIILIDNYVDESVLMILSKRKSKVSAAIYTKRISKRLELDLKKYHEQYPSIDVIEFQKSHDRFFIIDEKTVYHIGASLKDLGKKWFAFSKINLNASDLIAKLI